MCKALGQILEVCSMMLITTQGNTQKTKSTNNIGRKGAVLPLLYLGLFDFLEASHSFMYKFCGYLRERAMAGENSE